MGFSYFEAFSCSMHLGFPFWSDFFVSYTQCYTCWEVLQSFDFSWFWIKTLIYAKYYFLIWLGFESNPNLDFRRCQLCTVPLGKGECARRGSNERL
jgi:hypothetical protein